MNVLTEQQLNQLRKQLIEQRHELQKSLEQGSTVAETVGLDQSKVGRLSRMDALQQQAMAQAGLSRHKHQLKLINLAFSAMESGDYGYCTECDEEINFARLKAKPESQYCIKCQTNLEIE